MCVCAQEAVWRWEQFLKGIDTDDYDEDDYDDYDY